jgi:hypothetical protein
MRCELKRPSFGCLILWHIGVGVGWPPSFLFEMGSDDNFLGFQVLPPLYYIWSLYIQLHLFRLVSVPMCLDRSGPLEMQ